MEKYTEPQELLQTLQEESFALVVAARSNTLRSAQFPTATHMIKVATGMRRSGKTHFLYQTIIALLDHGVLKEQVLMLNFEDDRLLPMGAKAMGELLDAFYSLYPANHERPCYLFLDEVQNVTDWQLTVRRYFDSKPVQLYLTGSSSKLLSREIHTNLRGRSLSLEVFPYSFQEYQATHHIEPVKKPFGQASFDKMQQHLLRYFFVGGFPAVQSMQRDEWRVTLQGYVDTVILRDIVERYHVTNIALLKYLILTLLKNAATTFSINKFFNDVKSQGYKVGKETIHQYMEYIQEAFLIFVVPLYSKSARINQNKSKKIYAIDSGLVSAVSIDPHNLKGRLLENIVYLDLRRAHKEIYFYQTTDGYEVDFLTVDEQGPSELIQVTWDNKEVATKEREMRALLQAEKELGIKGRLITVRDYLKDGVG